MPSPSLTSLEDPISSKSVGMSTDGSDATDAAIKELCIGRQNCTATTIHMNASLVSADTYVELMGRLRAIDQALQVGRRQEVVAANDVAQRRLERASRGKSLACKTSSAFVDASNLDATPDESIEQVSVALANAMSAMEEAAAAIADDLKHHNSPVTVEAVSNRMGQVKPIEVPTLPPISDGVSKLAKVSLGSAKIAQSDA